MERWRRNLTDARLKMEKAQLLQKRYYDRHRRPEVHHELGDMLLVSKKHLTLPVDRDLPWKLRALWDGPYKVVKVLKTDEGKPFAYKLELPVHVQRTGLHDVFTAEKVVKYRGGSRWPSQQVTVPEPVMVEGQREHYVERIIRHRDRQPRGRPKRGEVKKPVREYLVKWTGLPTSEAEWRTVDKLNRGGILDKWREYELQLQTKDPNLISDEARRLLLSGSEEETENRLALPATDNVDIARAGSPGPDARSDDAQEEALRIERPVQARRRAAPVVKAGPPEGLRRSARLLQESCNVREALDVAIRRQETAAAAVAEYESEQRVVCNPVRRALVLFSGSGSVEQALRHLHPDIQIVSLDNDPKSAATRIVDIREFVRAEMFQYPPGYFDLVWASPPCTEYSRAMTTRPRELAGADRLVSSALACLVYLRPRFWFVENPDGHLRTRPLMLPYEPYLHPVSYCHYGTLYRKHTCIWTNAPGVHLLRCTVRTPCQHLQARGHHPCTAQAGPTDKVPGSGLGKRVYAIPPGLLQQLFSTLPL